MGVLKFDNTDDRLAWTTLASALANVSDGAWTMAALVRRETIGGFDAIGYLLSGAGNGVTEAGMSFSSSNFIINDADGASSTTSTALTDTTSPYMLVLSKTAGNTVARLGRKLGSGGAWTHENTAPAQPDQSASTMLQIGVWEGVSDPYDGWIGVVAYWEGAMSDGDKEALDDNWQTSDWWNSAHGQPAFLVELNVAAASVVDLAGNASSTSHVGTSLDAGETLDSWNFDGTGAPVAGPVVAWITA